MTVYGPGELMADYESLDATEQLARDLFRARWPGKAWSGRDVSRSYWRRKARTSLASPIPRYDRAAGVNPDPQTQGQKLHE